MTGGFDAFFDVVEDFLPCRECWGGEGEGDGFDFGVH